jgi:hypothetical protein
MLTFLETKLEADLKQESGGIRAFIPLGGEYHLVIARSTISKQAV